MKDKKIALLLLLCFLNLKFSIGNFQLIEQSEYSAHHKVLTINNHAMSSLILDGNAELDAYCTGTDGLIPETAHVIENITIDAMGTGDCLLLLNISRFLIIRNCSFLNGEYNPTYSGVRLINCSNIVIESNYCYNAYLGISLWNDCFDNVMDNNTCEDNHYGMQISHSNRNNITNNDLFGGYLGIYLDHAAATDISKNECFNIGGDGIFLFNSHGNSLMDNNCSTNLNHGISLSVSDNNQLNENNCALNGKAGINFLHAGENILEKNKYTANVEYGLILCNLSNNNVIRSPIFDSNNGGSANDQFIDNGTSNIFLLPTLYTSTLQIDGDGELDDLCLGTDGLTIETAHVIQNITVDVNNVGDCLSLQNIDRWLIIQHSVFRDARKDATGKSSIRLINCSNILIYNNRLEDSGTGLSLSECENITIDTNEFIENWHGFSLVNSHNNTLQNNQYSSSYEEDVILNSHQNILLEFANIMAYIIVAMISKSTSGRK